MQYAVLGGGQRVRPILATRVARMLDADGPLVSRAGCAVELLHCASLIVDDLPCMDDSPFRRGQPSCHRVYGEATAVLGAFALVALSARIVVERLEQSDPDRLLRFQKKLLGVLDCSSLIAGQSMDLALQGAQRDSHRNEISDLKTVPLFTLAVEAGSILSPEFGSPLLERFGREFGILFQMTDDWLDGEVDDPSGLERQFTKTSAALDPWGHRALPVKELIDHLHGRAYENQTQAARCHR